ncbi:hypothetical protein [Qipengyuania sp. JC766]|uniref:hypothetical protein n=1 Tax=Qipengyuania sp. JC766 TaxID=3232139 RepID=UPI0034593A21
MRAYERGADRRLRSGEHPNRAIAIAWLGLSLLLCLVALPNIMAGRLPDPDDALRLVQVRDLMAGQGWFDVTQYRIAGPDGTPMHWSRLVDVPVALAIAFFDLFLAHPQAETAALVLVPLLTFGATLACIGRLAWRLFDMQVAVLSCLVTGLLTALVFQIQPLRIDHHGWQIAAVAFAVWAISWRSHVRGGVGAGLAMAFGLAISIELLPVAAAFALVLFVRWWRERAARWWLVVYLQALALGLGALFLATRGVGDLAPYCDALSPAHLGFFLTAALGTGVVAAIPGLQRLGAFVLLGAVGVVALGFFGLSAPQCLRTPFGALDPLVRDFWYLNIAEGRPVWEQPFADIAPKIVHALAGLFAIALLVGRSSDWVRRWWTEYALLYALILLQAIFVARSFAFVAVLAAVPLGWLLSRMLVRLRQADGVPGKAAVAVALAAMLVPGGLIAAVSSIASVGQARASAPVREASCDPLARARNMDRLPAGTVFAPLDIGPAILLESDHSVVATSHHRAEDAMRDVIAAFIAKPADAEPIVRQRGARYLALCSDLAEARLYAAARPDGLAAQIIAGREPEWLEPIAMPGADEFRLYRVRPR